MSHPAARRGVNPSLGGKAEVNFRVRGEAMASRSRDEDIRDGRGHNSGETHYHINGYIQGQFFWHVRHPDWGDSFEELRQIAKEERFPQLSSSSFGWMDGKDIDEYNCIRYSPCSIEYDEHKKDLRSYGNVIWSGWSKEFGNGVRGIYYGW